MRLMIATRLGADEIFALASAGSTNEKVVAAT
jgi:hypothetical protein